VTTNGPKESQAPQSLASQELAPSMKPASASTFVTMGPGALDAARILGASLDALVRGLRTSAQRPTVAAERCLQYWKQVTDPTMTVLALSLKVDGKVALEVNAEQGRFVLPLFLSGVQSLAPREEATVEDLILLAEQFARLGPTVTSIKALENWFFADGAECFDVKMSHSFIERVGDDADLGKRLEAALIASRLSAVGSSASVIATEELNQAALRDEFDVPLDLYAQSTNKRPVTVSEQERSSIKSASDDEGVWLEAELTLALSGKHAESVIAPTRLARRIRYAFAQGHVTLGLLFWDRLRKRTDVFAVDARKHLETADLGVALGKALGAGTLLPSHVKELVALCTDEMCVHLGKEYVRREIGSFAALPLLLQEKPQLAGEWASAAFTTKAVLSMIDALSALEHTGQGDAFLAVLGAISPQRLAAVLEVVQVNLLEKSAAKLGSFVTNLSSPQRAGVLRRCADSDTLMTGFVIPHLRQTHAKGLVGKELYNLCKSLLRTPQGRALVAELALDVRGSEEARLVMIDVASQVPDLKAKLCKFRFGMFMDPPAVANKIRGLKKEAT
jgi:hypothetical protein